jgi:hypothetical protein
MAPAQSSCSKLLLQVLLACLLLSAGDHSLTALAIAGTLGIAGQGLVLTGPQLDAMDDAALAHVVTDCNVFARASPENKLRIVRALQVRVMVWFVIHTRGMRSSMEGGGHTTCASTASSLNLRRANARRPLTHVQVRVGMQEGEIRHCLQTSTYMLEILVGCLIILVKVCWAVKG